MSQKKEKKKVIKKNVSKQTTTKKSVNVKIGIDDLLKMTCASCAANDKKKKPKERNDNKPKQ